MNGLIEIPKAADEVREANDKRYGGGMNQCLICRKGMTEKGIEKAWWVHMTTTLMLAPIGTEVPDSQGLFPVGSECAKKVPPAYRTRD